MFFFFFSSRRRHTRFDCDWSSDVCSSDLEGQREERATDHVSIPPGGITRATLARFTGETRDVTAEIGRASCRERSVDLGGRRIIKKKKKRRRGRRDV